MRDFGEEQEENLKPLNKMRLGRLETLRPQARQGEVMIFCCKVVFCVKFCFTSLVRQLFCR